MLLRAPAGYSKTTCLREWQAADDRPFAFVGCTARLDDPAFLVEVLVEQLGEDVVPAESGVLDALGTLTPEIDTVLSRLGRAIERWQQPVVIVLDDVHLLKGASTQDALQGLVEILPGNAQLAIATRTEPTLHLGRMRANRAVVELGATDLAMSRDESSRMLAGMGLDLDRESLSALHERTEGWPAALYLAGLALTGEHDPAAAAADFAGDDRLLVDYLRDEFLATLTPAKAQFLIRSSVLDDLSGPICDVALDRSGSARILHALARENALIVPLDRKDERYRCHHLLAEMLHSELNRREPDAGREIRARASRWYAEQGDLVRAVDQAIAAGETDWAGSLIWEAFPELSSHGRLATLDRWLAMIGERTVATSIPLALSAAHRSLTLGDGDATSHWARTAATASPANGASRLEGDLLLLTATLAREGVAQMGTDAEQASMRLAPESAWQSPCKLYQGVSLHLSGHPDRAAPLLSEAISRGAASSTVIETLARAQLALITLDEGDSETALSLAGHAHAQVRQYGLDGYTVEALVFAVAALVFGRTARVEQSIDQIVQCRRLVERFTSFPSWYEAEVYIVLAKACTQVDDLARAKGLLNRADLTLEELDDAPVLERWSASARGEVERAEQQPRADALTKAELRVLQHLPTHLSFKEIGDRLFLSVNTIKAQAKSAYRKLDVTSRAEAVDRAQALGLLSHEDERL